MNAASTAADALSLTLSPREAYERMLRIRLFEERCQALREREVIAGSIHLCAGQEAVPVGARAALRGDDRTITTYRGHGWAIACGVPLNELMAEVCHRATGLNGGRGGSAYFTAPEHGFVGENSIVGAGLPIAAGVALAGRLAGTDRVAVVSIGDGATSQGAVHEGVVFAAGERLPLVVVCENNGWSEMTAINAVVSLENLAQRAVGYGIEGATIDGCDALAVERTVAEAAARARAGGGPMFIECKTVRLWGHYNADIEHYRPEEDKTFAVAADPLARARRVLLEASAISASELEELETHVRAEIDAAERFALESQPPDPTTARDHVVREVPPSAPAAPAEGAGTQTTFVRAVNEALKTELAERPEVVVFGEDVGVAGGVFGATRNLQKEFGRERVFDTPIAEAAILGCAIGLATEGFRPVAEIMWSDFLLVALDQLINQAANARYLSRGRMPLPLVVRTQQGVTPGSCAQHSQSLEALLAHIPGLRLGLPATSQDAYSMLRAAIAEDDPCVLIESRALYQVKGPLSTVPDVSVGGARAYGSGDDLCIVTWGRMLHTVRVAADQLVAEGVATRVLDLRWLSPLDDAAIAEAVTRSRRILIVHEANVTGGFGAEIAARIGERHFDSLDAPVRRIGAPDVRFPAAPVLQQELLPDAKKVAEAARVLLAL